VQVTARALIALALAYPAAAAAQKKVETDEQIICVAALDGAYQKDSPLVISEDGGLAFLITQNTGTLTLHALTRDCDILWELNAGKLLGTPTVSGGLVYYAAVPSPGKGVLEARDSEGKKKGSYSFDASRRLHPPQIAPDGTIYFAYDDKLVALTPEFKQKWSFQGKGDLEPPIVGPDSVPYVYTSRVGDGNDFLMALDPKKGGISWRFTLGLQNQVVFAKDHLVAISKDPRATAVYGVDQKGKQLFALDLNRAGRFSPGKDGVVYLIGEPAKGGGARLIALDAAGKVSWEGDIKESSTDPLASRLAVSPDGDVAVATNTKKVVVFSAAGKKLFTKSFGELVLFDAGGALHAVDPESGKATRATLDLKSVETEEVGEMRAVAVSKGGIRYFAGKRDFVVVVPKK
jgi:outer membrane protein assembly factor BamB